ncbi:MAG: XRE family transcriptional regulator [Lachnospiraceae bacterium]|nr:XRE family transcriptional regulator [Lachnospiraceae bacterium]
MEYLSKNIAINLKGIRKSKNMSLDMVAEQTGVSKSMLAQIERGEANPTIGTLGRIVSGMRVEFDTLITAPKVSGYQMQRSKMIPTKELSGQYQVYTCFPYETDRRFEIYEIEVEPGKKYLSGAHGEHTEEYISVTRGELTIELSGERYTIQEKDGFCFHSDKEHEYCNYGEERLEFLVYFIF